MSDRQAEPHTPVLPEEVIRYLQPQRGSTVVDCTLGSGGHYLQILKLLGDEGLGVGIDKDLLAIENVRRRIERSHSVPASARLIEGNFGELLPLLHQAHIPPAGGILLDLGPSSSQLFDPKLGMSWESDQALDMRLDRKADATSAADIINEWTEEDLARLFTEQGEEKWSRRIAQRIVRDRAEAAITTGRRLGEIVAAAIPRKAWPPKIHPATRVFMALRMEVNGELDNLRAVLPQAVEALAPGGRLVIISFHSIEDRIVKRFLREMAQPIDQAPWPLPQTQAGPARLKILTRRPVTASAEEVASNPRSRSAKLRAAEKPKSIPAVES